MKMDAWAPRMPHEISKKCIYQMAITTKHVTTTKYQIKLTMHYQICCDKVLLQDKNIKVQILYGGRELDFGSLDIIKFITRFMHQHDKWNAK